MGPLPLSRAVRRLGKREGGGTRRYARCFQGELEWSALIMRRVRKSEEWIEYWSCRISGGKRDLMVARRRSMKRERPMGGGGREGGMKGSFCVGSNPSSR